MGVHYNTNTNEGHKHNLNLCLSLSLIVISNRAILLANPAMVKNLPLVFHAIKAER